MRSARTGSREAASRNNPAALVRGSALMRLLVPLLLMMACRPPTVTPSSMVPTPAPVVVAPAVVPAPLTVAPAPEPGPQLEPAPSWEWAVSVLPELAGHSEVDPSVAALARFVGWFGEGKPARIYLLDDGVCRGITGTMSDDGFHGGWRMKVTIRGGEKQVSGMSLDITRGGISESGPGGVIYHRDGKGRWMEVGGFGIGDFATIVDQPMSSVDDHALTFAGHGYRLEPVCDATERVTRTCIGEGAPRCERCTRITLERRTEHSGGSTRIGIGRVDPTPVDCTQACPADEWTPLVPRLAAALAGRRFFGALPAAGPVVFRSAGACARERRRRAAAIRREQAMAARSGVDADDE